jgi:hypothetical protein
MSRFIKCVRGKIRTDLLDEEQIDELEKLVNDLTDQYSESMGSLDAAAQAASEVVEAKAKRLRHEKLVAMKSSVTLKRLFEGADSTIELKKDRVGGLKLFGMQLIPERSKEARFGAAMMSDIETMFKRAKHYEEAAWEMMDELGVDFRSNLVGDPTEAAIRIIPDLYEDLIDGTKNGRKLKIADKSDPVRKVLDNYYSKFRVAGGYMNYQKNFMPGINFQKDILEELNDVDWFVKIIMSNVNRRNMIDLDTGLPFAKQKLEKVVRGIHKSILNNGNWTMRQLADDGTIEMRPEYLDLKYGHKFFEWKDAAAMRRVNNEFGGGDVALVDNFKNYISGLSRDIAVLEVTGGSPRAYKNRVILEMENRRVSEWRVNMFKSMFDNTTGLRDDAYGALDNSLVNGVNKVMAWQRGVHLTATTLKALNDTVYIGTAAKMNGLPVTEALHNFVRLLDPTNKEHRELARISKMTLDKISRNSAAATKLGGEAFTTGLPNKASNLAVNITGLTAWNSRVKGGPTLTAYQTLGRYVSKRTKWGELDPDFKRALEAHKITRADWDIISKSKLSFDPETQIPMISEREIALVGAEELKPMDTPYTFDFIDRGDNLSTIDMPNGRGVSVLKEGRGYRVYFSDEDINGRHNLLAERARLEKAAKSPKADEFQTDDFIERMDMIDDLLDSSEQMGDIFPTEAAAHVFIRRMFNEELKVKRKGVDAIVANRVAIKWADYVQTVRQVSSNEPSAFSIAATTGGFGGGETRHGSVNRMLWQSTLAYKSWSINQMLNHLLPILDRAQRYGKHDELVGMFVASALVGSVSVQLDNIANGRTPEDMGYLFWKKALSVGGALGLLGDVFLGDTTNIFDRGAEGTTTSPALSLAADINHAFQHSADRLAKGKEPNFSNDIWQLIKSQTPVARAWMWRPIVDYLIFDAIDDFFDDEAPKKRRTKEKKMRREKGQEFYLDRAMLDKELIDGISVDDQIGEMVAQTVEPYKRKRFNPETAVASSDDRAAQEMLIGGEAEQPSAKAREDAARAFADSDISPTQFRERRVPRAKNVILRGNNINYTEIARYEGGMQLTGYVPEEQGNTGIVAGKSGVTISTGVDLGAQSEAGLRAAGVSEEIITKVRPYLGMKFTGQNVNDANEVAEQLTLTEAEAKELYEKVKAKSTELTIKEFNSKGGLNFRELTPAWQTVVASIGYQYGHTGGPNFFGYVADGDFEAAKEELQNFELDENGNLVHAWRRGEELQLIENEESTLGT